MRQAGGELAEGGETVAAADGCFGCDEVLIGFGELFGGGLVAGGLCADGFAEGVNEESGDGGQEAADGEDVFGFGVEIDLIPVDVDEKRQVGADGGDCADESAGETEVTGGGDDGQEQHQVIGTFDGSGETDEQVAEDELEDDGGGAAPGGVEHGQAAFDQLQDREPGHERHLPGIVGEDDQCAEHDGEEGVLDAEFEGGTGHASALRWKVSASIALVT